MGNLLGFIGERAKSLVSKKLGAAIAGEVVAAGAAPDMQGIPLIVYIVAQAIVDAFKYWVDSRRV